MKASPGLCIETPELCVQTNTDTEGLLKRPKPPTDGNFRKSLPEKLEKRVLYLDNVVER